MRCWTNIDIFIRCSFDESRTPNISSNLKAMRIVVTYTLKIIVIMEEVMLGHILNNAP